MKEIKYSDILSAKETTRDAVNEASLGRIYQHIQKSDTNSFGILTSWRYAATPEEKKKNVENFKNLQSQLQSANLGFFQLRGHWLECQNGDTPYEKCPEEELMDVVEPSLFVPNIPFKMFQSLLSQFNQDGGIYSGPETDGKVSLITKGGDSTNIGSFTPNKISRAYSNLRGKHNFVFEWRPHGYFQGVMTEVWEKEQKKTNKPLFPLK